MRLTNNETEMQTRQDTARKTQDDKARQDRTAWSLAGFGFEFAGVMAIFGYAGYWADQKLSHGIPWLMLIALGVAFLGMIGLLFKETAKWRK